MDFLLLSTALLPRVPPNSPILLSAMSPRLQILPVQAITTADFAPYGQVIWPAADGATFGPNDAQLKLDQGIPRFYIMQLHGRGRRFQAITRHQRCTQCLGSLQGQEWLLAVAPPDAASVPDLSYLRAFRIPGTCFIKLEVGTWHAGPYFDADTVSFYNLELSDTNEVDHDTCNLARQFGVEFEFEATDRG